MTTKISCKVYHIYEKAIDNEGPKLSIYVEPSIKQILQLFFAWVTGKTYFLWHEYSTAEINAIALDIRRWWLVKGLRGYKHRAK